MVTAVVAGRAFLISCCPPGMSVFFFFQAEGGIRDLTVTGVQTCALPIWTRLSRRVGIFFGCAPEKIELPGIGRGRFLGGRRRRPKAEPIREPLAGLGRKTFRSEERRVGKEGRSRWSPDH